MIAKEEFINSNQPATKGDLEQLREDLQADMVNAIESAIGTAIGNSESRVNKKLEAILAVVEDTNAKISNRDRELEGLPERMNAVEDDILKLKAQAR